MRFDVVRGADLGEPELRGMLALLEREHPRWPYAASAVDPLDHLTWKTVGPDGNGLVVRGFEGDELVGLMLAYFSRARLAGREVTRNHLNDSTTRSDHQGRGFSVPRHQAFATSERGRAPHLEITRAANPLAQSVMARRGFDVVACPIDIFVKVLDPGRFAADWLDGRRLPGAARVLQAAGRMAQLGRRAAAGERSDLAISPLRSFGAAEDELYERVAPGFDLICDRRGVFMNWRYLDPRAGGFTVRAARSGDALLGYCVCRVDRGRGCIADLVALPDRPAAAVALLEDASEILRAQGASGVSGWVPRRHPHAAAMRAAGFVRLPRPATLVYRLVDLPLLANVLRDPRAGLDFALGDTDEV